MQDTSKQLVPNTGELKLLGALHNNAIESLPLEYVVAQRGANGHVVPAQHAGATWVQPPE
eukprot:4750401-Amphidinium_carterae.1